MRALGCIIGTSSTLLYNAKLFSSYYLNAHSHQQSIMACAVPRHWQHSVVSDINFCQPDKYKTVPECYHVPDTRSSSKAHFPHAAPWSSNCVFSAVKSLFHLWPICPLGFHSGNSLHVNLLNSLKTYPSELPPKINPSKACLYGISYKKFSGDHFKYAEFVSLNQDVENYPNYPYIVRDSCSFPSQISLNYSL